jgi:hypothetical protein
MLRLDDVVAIPTRIRKAYAATTSCGERNADHLN